MHIVFHISFILVLVVNHASKMMRALRCINWMPCHSPCKLANAITSFDLKNAVDMSSLFQVAHYFVKGWVSDHRASWGFHESPWKGCLLLQPWQTTKKLLMWSLFDRNWAVSTFSAFHGRQINVGYHKGTEKKRMQPHRGDAVLQATGPRRLEEPDPTRHQLWGLFLLYIICLTLPKNYYYLVFFFKWWLPNRHPAWYRLECADS